MFSTPYIFYSFLPPKVKLLGGSFEFEAYISLEVHAIIPSGFDKICTPRWSQYAVYFLLCSFTSKYLFL